MPSNSSSSLTDFMLNIIDSDEMWISNSFEVSMIKRELDSKKNGILPSLGPLLNISDQKFCLQFASGWRNQVIEFGYVSRRQGVPVSHWMQWSNFRKFSAFCYYGTIPGYNFFTSKKQEINGKLDDEETKPLVIMLDSLGGARSGTKEMQDWIEEQKLNRPKIYAHLPKNSICASACVPIFMSADIRTADPTARIGLHSGLLSGTDELTDMTWYIDNLVELGVNEKEVSLLVEKGTFETKDMSFFSNRKLKQLNFVNKIISDEQYMEFLDSTISARK